MDESKNPPGQPIRTGVTVLALAALALAAYQVYSGVWLKRIGIPGVFDIDFAEGPISRPVASREFMLGRWQGEQTLAGMSEQTTLDFLNDGTCAGVVRSFVGISGIKQDVSCRWSVQKLTSDTFRLTISTENLGSSQGTYKILDQNHLHNLNDNSIAVRVR